MKSELKAAVAAMFLAQAKNGGSIAISCTQAGFFSLVNHGAYEPDSNPISGETDDSEEKGLVFLSPKKWHAYLIALVRAFLPIGRFEGERFEGAIMAMAAEAESTIPAVSIDTFRADRQQENTPTKAANMREDDLTLTLPEKLYLRAARKSDTAAMQAWQILESELSPAQKVAALLVIVNN